MAILKSIELSNIRRFSSNVKIDIGPGATILLAPNGTGKTAVFEAIELALTGNIFRLGSDFIPVIKDGEKEASVTLNFDDWNRKISVTENGVKEDIAGELGSIFPDVEPSYYPYLLRLTHLLDQRGKQWFVQGNSDDAGEHLSRLPLGREASQIFQKMTPIKRALTVERTSISKQLDDLTVTLTRWDYLVGLRAESLSSIKPLVPLDTILIQSGLGNSDLSGVTPADLSYVREQLGVITRETKNSLENLRGQLAKVAGFFPSIDRYKELLNQRSGRMLSIESAQDSIASLNSEIDVITTRMAKNETELKAVGIEFGEASQKKEKQEALELERSKYNGSLAAFAEIKALSDTNKKLLDEARITYSRLKKIDDKHAYVIRTRSLLFNEAAKLSNARSALESWKDAGNNVKKSLAVIAQFSSSISLLEAELQSAGEDVISIEQRLSEAEVVLDSLVGADDRMKAALAQLSACIDPSSDECPVCATSVGALNIRSSLEAALNAVGPHYIIASKKVDEINLELAAQQSYFESESAKFQELRAKLGAERLELAKQQNILDSDRANELLQGLEIVEATKLLDIKSEDLDRQNYDLALEESSLPPALHADALQALTEEIQKLETEGDRVSSRLNDGLAYLQLVSSKLIDLEAEVLAQLHFEEPEALGERRTLLASSIVADSERRNIIFLKKGDEERSIELLKDGLRGDELALEQIKASWSDQSMTGDPTAELLESKKVTLLADIGNAEKRLKVLESNEEELSRWGTHMEIETLQQEIDQIRVRSTEDDYHSNAKVRLKLHQDKLSKIDRVRTALNGFSEKLGLEIESIQDKISDVVPLWRTLLNRIVREPRFGKTDLSYYSERNRAKAKVHINLGPHEVSVASVASEAQMTDIQLSFLLSMSLTHGWSPWKALLLDDPTQHHDLVHAASVFDLLRDFISDHGYQIVIATHEASQARFFLRKLLNDGIEAKIINLQSSDDGVVVKNAS